MKPTLSGWALAFLLTQAVEIPIYLRAQRGERLSRALAIAFGASAITHPVVWFVFPGIADAIFLAMAQRGWSASHSEVFRMVAFGGLCEGFAVAVEALYLRALRVQRPLFWSLIANLASASIGYLCWSITGFP
jgi:RsiW-degrading membrane proteinase PrsW (M82 family)